MFFAATQIRLAFYDAQPKIVWCLFVVFLLYYNSTELHSLMWIQLNDLYDLIRYIILRALWSEVYLYFANQLFGWGWRKNLVLRLQANFITKRWGKISWKDMHIKVENPSLAVDKEHRLKIFNKKWCNVLWYIFFNWIALRKLYILCYNSTVGFIWNPKHFQK